MNHSSRASSLASFPCIVLNHIALAPLPQSLSKDASCVVRCRVNVAALPTTCPLNDHARHAVHRAEPYRVSTSPSVPLQRCVLCRALSCERSRVTNHLSTERP